jgi:phospholipid/cholesterol/gamma-HCH transport system permease protein
MKFQGPLSLAKGLEGLGRLTMLAWEAFASLLTLRVAWRDFLYQVYFVGVKSQSVVLITGAFTGMVLGVQ